MFEEVEQSLLHHVRDLGGRGEGKGMGLTGALLRRGSFPRHGPGARPLHTQTWWEQNTPPTVPVVFPRQAG